MKPSVLLLVLGIFIGTFLFFGCADGNDPTSSSNTSPQEQLLNVLQRYNTVSEDKISLPPSDQLGSSWHILYQSPDFNVSCRIYKDDLQILHRYSEPPKELAYSFAKNFCLAFDSRLTEAEILEGLQALTTQHDGRGNTFQMGEIYLSYTQLVLCTGDWEYEILLSYPKNTP
jgi:hypothetical protein